MTNSRVPFVAVALSLAGAALLITGAWSCGGTSKSDGVRRCLSFNYTGQPEPGERRWETEGDGNWVEIYPSGTRNPQREIERTVIDGCPYVIAGPLGDDPIRIRFPLESCGDRSFMFSRDGTNYTLLGVIQSFACGSSASDGGAADLSSAKDGSGGSDAGNGTDGGMTYTSSPITTPTSHRKNTGDTCTSWQVNEAPVRASTCSYSGGGSGYYVVENTGTVPADLCWTISFNAAGKNPESGCKRPTAVGDTQAASCFSCGQSNGGAKAFELTLYEAK